jgi:large subunit ribosomal protein L25
MSEHFELALQTRDNLGTQTLKRLRREQNLVPAVLYGGNEQPQHLQIAHRAIAKALGNEGFYTHVLTLNVDGKKQKAILRAVQQHPCRAEVIHVDFMRVSANQILNMTIPFHFINEDIAPGVKVEGGVVEHQMVKVEVKCRADHIPEYIEIDLQNLQLNQSIHLSDIKLPKGVEIPELALGAEHNRMIVVIHEPRVMEEPEPIPVATEEVAPQQPEASEAAPE